MNLFRIFIFLNSFCTRSITRHLEGHDSTAHSTSYNQSNLEITAAKMVTFDPSKNKTAKRNDDQ